jgi:hypothetical protein
MEVTFDSNLIFSSSETAAFEFVRILALTIRRDG